MPTRALSAPTVGQNCTAPVAVPPMPTMHPASIRGVYKPGCELFRKRIECAIMMKVAEEQDRESTASETSENV